MEYLRQRAVGLIDAGVARNTTLTYKTALNSFDSFRRQYGLPLCWPANLEQIIWFVTYCFEKGLSPKTITTYIAGLSFYHKLRNWSDISEIFVIKKLLEGCRRSRSSIDLRRPISINMLAELVNILSRVCYSSYETKLFSAIFLLAYFGLFRVSELVETRGCHADRALQSYDVKFGVDKKSINVSIRSHKTKQTGLPTVLRIPCESNSALCPVCSLREFCAIRPLFTGPLFCHINRQPVTRTQFSGVLDKCVKKSSFNCGLYKSHSFRIGRATQLASMGLSGENIMKMGRWRSNAYVSYLR